MQIKVFGFMLIAMLLAGTASAQSLSLYEDVSATHLPSGVTDRLSMDAAAADIDGDGDLDIVVANEWRSNYLLLNNGAGQFSVAPGAFQNIDRDSEDVGIADFDGNGMLDVVIVTEDDRVNEFYLATEPGVFIAAHDRLPRTDTTNDVLVTDINGDGSADILLGNNGQNGVLINTGNGHFTDETSTRLPARQDVTQDLHFGDVDGDGDGDLLEGNEGDNRLLLNDGTGHFVDAPEGALPLRRATEETREADFGDADGDGDLDILFANVRFFSGNGDPQNRLLLNDGTGVFTDDTETHLPQDVSNSAEGDFVDLDGDGDLDIVTPAVTGVSERGSSRWRALENDGSGHFTDATERFLPETAIGNGFDALAADFDGDGHGDLYLANRIGPDVLLLRRP